MLSMIFQLFVNKVNDICAGLICNTSILVESGVVQISAFCAHTESLFTGHLKKISALSGNKLTCYLLNILNILSFLVTIGTKIMNCICKAKRSLSGVNMTLYLETC